MTQIRTERQPFLPHDRVRLLVGVLAWREQEEGLQPSGPQDGIAHRFLSASEPLWYVCGTAPAVVRDVLGAEWRVPLGFLAPAEAGRVPA